MEAWTARAIDANDFADYRDGIVHEWLRTLTTLAVVLVPLFFILDYFVMPAVLLPRFAVYRFISTVLALAQFLVVRNTRPSRISFLHGYFISLQVGGIIALMTVDLGGFNSTYYAGLTLVVIGVNLLMPWRATHTAINAIGIIAMYVVFNVIAGKPFDQAKLTNNLFFLCSTAVLAVSINHVRYNLIEKEFSLLVKLKKARDALWGEMELAKRIQTALLPQRKGGIRGFESAVTMLPAREVGGDYYDIIETDQGDRWVAIGDVAGHGVDSGLIMMMAQASIMTVIKGNPTAQPIDVLSTTNSVIKEDIGRLGSNHYMTMMVVKLEDDGMIVAGHHQDVLVYRSALSSVSAIPTKGTWLGITDRIEAFLEVKRIEIADNDVALFFTDGVTEGANAAGEMYGQERLQRVFAQNADLPVEKALERILDEVRSFQVDQADDMTLILLKKIPRDQAKKPRGGGDA
ncbi:MAG TPA: PP2C family protein-serine/threonine phosphatase [Spirochaetia bacterium]|nr:PP2C family protein-serine/threonine phosphatase [Spirochaetia bacterium]